MAGLLSLIGQAIGGPAAEATPTIVVNGERPAPRSAPKPLQSLLAEPDPKLREELAGRAENYPERKGKLFGTKGTLRDVLGTLGDAFLVQSGNKAVYGPRRDQERLSDALAGLYTGNESEQLAALEQASYENPEMAQQIYSDYMQNKARQAQVQSLSDGRESVIADRKYKQLQDFGNYAARLLAKADTPERRTAAMNVIKTRAAKLEIDPTELGINDDMTDDERAVLGAGDMTVNQQQQLPLAQQRVGIAQQNADSQRISATRPRNPPRPPARIPALERVKDKIAAGEKLTPGEQRLYDDAQPKSRGSGRRSGGGPSTPQSGGKLVFRNGKLVAQ